MMIRLPSVLKRVVAMVPMKIVQDALIRFLIRMTCTYSQERIHDPGMIWLEICFLAGDTCNGQWQSLIIEQKCVKEWVVSSCCGQCWLSS